MIRVKVGPLGFDFNFDSSLSSFQIVALTLEINQFNSSDAILKLGDVRCLHTTGGGFA